MSVSVKDYGATGDGSTDDTTAIQAAFDSGAEKVIFPKGTYKTGALTLPDWLNIESEGYQPGVSPGTAAVELMFTLTSGSALTCGHNPTIKNIYFTNNGGTYNDTTKGCRGQQQSP